MPLVAAVLFVGIGMACLLPGNGESISSACLENLEALAEDESGEVVKCFCRSDVDDAICSVMGDKRFLLWWKSMFITFLELSLKIV